ncbi:MAG TPA: FMN-binding protein [Clostridiales bacterium]|nr:FMN-binding protein [Clostridiales bacterium]
MMKDNRIKGIIALAIVTIISFGIIYGTKSLVKVDDSNNEQGNNVEPTEGILVVDESYEGVDSAWEIKDDAGNVTGYAVKASARGFVGPVVLQVDFDLDGKTIQNLTVVSSNETEGYGSKMEDEDYLKQFPGTVAPVHFEGESASNTNKDDLVIQSASVVNTLKDGIYIAEADDFIGGYKSIVTIKVENSEITSVVWDQMDELGQYKSYLSSTGKYVMTEDGLTWKEQADKLAANVIENQSTSDININDEGETDSVTGVSISVNEFTDLVEKALLKASGPTEEESNNETSATGSSQIDAISGATHSSDAIKTAINRAYTFINDYLNK